MERRARAAFSVIEITIASLVLLVAIALASRLLQDVGMQVAWSGRKAIEMSPDLALEQLRTDLRASFGTLDTYGMWLSAPLSITGSASGHSIVYSIEDGNLERRTIAPGGTVLANRMVLDKVVDLRYRFENNAVEIEIEFLRIKPPLRRDTAAGMRESQYPDRRKVRIMVSPRRLPTESF